MRCRDDVDPDDIMRLKSGEEADGNSAGNGR